MRNVTKTKVVTLIGLLLGGLSLSYADAPIASLDVNSGTVQVQPLVPQNSTIPANTGTSSSNNTTPVATTAPAPQQPPQPVVNSEAILATLTPEQRIARLENQVQYLSTYNSQLQTLSTEVNLLRGQIEDLNYQLSQMKKQLNSLTANTATPATDNTGNAPTGMAANNSNIVTTNSATNATATTNTTSSATPAAPSAKEQAAFNQAYTLLVKQQYTQATTGFTNFLTTYPNSSLAADAHYWLGDLYLAQGQPDNASQQYRAVVNIQGATKRPDAMVKLGTILLAYGDSAHAKQLFQQVIQQYPNSPAATQAQSRLKSM